MDETTIHVDGMSCQHCVMAVRRSLQHAGNLPVVDVRIGSVTVGLPASSPDVERVREAIRSAGYTPVS